MDTLIGSLGTLGVILLLIAYFLLIIGQIRATDAHHIALNMLGALFTVIAMHLGQSVPLFLTLVGWLFISLYGLYKHHIATTD